MREMREVRLVLKIALVASFVISLIFIGLIWGAYSWLMRKLNSQYATYMEEVVQQPQQPQVVAPSTTSAETSMNIGTAIN